MEQDYSTVANELFLKWLTANGASFPKINWPSNETASGIRGAVCTADISANEHMIQIPADLMLSPPKAFDDAEVGSYLRQHADMLSGDVLLTIYLMHELRKNVNSFYFPFLNILPTPCNVTEWSANQLAFLQVCYPCYVSFRLSLAYDLIINSIPYVG